MSLLLRIRQSNKGSHKSGKLLNGLSFTNGSGRHRTRTITKRTTMKCSLVMKLLYLTLLLFGLSCVIFTHSKMELHLPNYTNYGLELFEGISHNNNSDNTATTSRTVTAGTARNRRFQRTGNVVADAAGLALHARHSILTPLFNYSYISATDQTVNVTTLVAHAVDGERNVAVKRAAAHRLEQKSNILYINEPTTELFELHPNSNNDNSKPTMAILVATRSTPNQTTAATSLLNKHLLTSLSKTITPDERRYWNIGVWVAVDDSDTWWIRNMRQLKTPGWLQVHIGIFPDQGPRIPFNEIARVASTSQSNPDYYCRVNDDTEFQSNGWLTAAVTKLQSYNPPNLGVVGPTCGQGNVHILTHDFVHRTHLDIFGTYYPSTFSNWYLDDWISHVYGTSRTTTLKDWRVKHWTYKTRYSYTLIDAQWLPAEYKIGELRINQFLQKMGQPLVQPHVPKLRPIVQELLKVVPKDGNILVWGLDDTVSPALHNAVTGRVYFVEDKADRRAPQKKTYQWSIWVNRKYPYLEYDKVKYLSNKRAEELYNQYVMGDGDLCELQIPLFPNHVFNTDWDVMLIDAPRKPEAETDDGTGPGVFQPMYMSYLLAVSRMASGQRKKPLHLFIDDYNRGYEKDFAQKLFGDEEKQPVNKDLEFAHYILEGSYQWVAPNCPKAPVRDYDAYKKGDYDKAQVEMILNTMPYRPNILIWGASHDVVFWNQTTGGRLVVLEDKSLKRENGTLVLDEFQSLYPDLEIYGVEYTTRNNDETFQRYVKSPEFWEQLQMDLPASLYETHWDTILIDSPLGCCDAGPGRYQSIYMSKVLAGKGQTLTNETAVTSIFVDDHERKIEADFSLLVFDKEPVQVLTRGQKKEPKIDMGHYFLDRSDFALSLTESPFTQSRTTVVREKSAFPDNGQMGWEQVTEILSALPENGNLLVWGFKPETEFLSRVTTGRVIFLEDAAPDTSVVKEELRFDAVTAALPNIEAYKVKYSTKNDGETFDYYNHHPERWGSLEMELPEAVIGTRWNVIVVASPLGCCSLGPGRFQSLFMTKVLAKTSLKMKFGDVHVFVDDYDRRLENQLSLQMYGRPPLKVIERGGTTPNRQAHFAFGNTRFISAETVVEETTRLIPWKSPGRWDTPKAGSPLADPKGWMILLEVNDGYFDFFLNWFHYYEKLNLDIVVVVMAEDKPVFDKLKKIGSPKVIVESSTTQLDHAEAFDYDTKSYNKLVSGRAKNILRFLKSGKNVIYSDIDTVWRSSPLPYLMDFDEADMILQVDNPSWIGFSPYYCTGFMAVKSTPLTVRLMEDWGASLEKEQLNQPVFNEVLHKHSMVKHQPLPAIEFPAGRDYFDKYTQNEKDKAVVVHNNYIMGREKKKQRFVANNLWALGTLDSLPFGYTPESNHDPRDFRRANSFLAWGRSKLLTYID